MEENNRPILTIVAGPNGSGKSTLVNLLLEGEDLGVFINADVIVSNISKRKGEAIASVETQWEAAIAAEEMRWSLLGQKASFISETVMSDVDRWFRFLSAAKEAGFFITLVYVSTISPDVNINRVQIRVSEGGHNVSEDKIISRYYKSMNASLPMALKIVDQAYIYDNSLADVPAIALGHFINGRLSNLRPKKFLPGWYLNIKI